MSAATSSDSSTPPTNKRSPGATGQRAAGAGASDDVLGAPPAIDDTAAVQSTGTAPAPAGEDAPAAKRHKASEEEQLDTDAAGPPADLHVAPGASQPQQQPPSIGAIDAPPMPQVMPGHQLMVVTCPAGVDPGSIVRSQEPGGASFDVAVPAGVGPGQKFYVQVQTGGSATIEPPWTACYTAAGDGSNHQPGQLYYVNLVTKESRWDPPTSSSSTAAVMSTTAMQTEQVPTATIATQTIQLLGGAADTAPVPAASPSAASGHSSGSTSPPVSPLEPPVIAPPPTREHAAIAAIESRLAPHEQEKAALLAQQELIKEQRKELNRQMALIRERLEVVKPKLLPGQQELRGRKSYLQLLVEQPKSETDTELRAAQSRMALACGGHARLGLTALLQNIDISECVVKHVATAVVERRKLEEFGQAAANARKQLQFGVKLEGIPAAEYNGIYKVDHERLGAPVLKNEDGKCLFWCPGNKSNKPSWYFKSTEPPATSADPSETMCCAHTLPWGTPQVKAGYLPEGSQTWKCWSDNDQWEDMQFTTTIFRTEIQAADAETADKAAIKAELNEKAAAATAQLAGVDQIVVSGLPSQLESTDVALADGTYHRCNDIDGAAWSPAIRALLSDGAAGLHAMSRFNLEMLACAPPLKIHLETIQNLSDDDDGKDALVQIILDREAEYNAEQDYGFPVFKLPFGVGSSLSSWLLYNKPAQKWVITELFVAGAKPDPNETFPNTAVMVSTSSDGTLDVGVNSWNCHGYHGGESVGLQWRNKMITVTPQQSSI